MQKESFDLSIARLNATSFIQNVGIVLGQLLRIVRYQLPFDTVERHNCFPLWFDFGSLFRKPYGIGLLGVTRLDWVAIHILMAIVMHEFSVIINLLPADIFSPRGKN